MYKILVIDAEINENKKSDNKIKNIKLNELNKELKEVEYDFIYVEEKTKDMEEIILEDYILVPNELKSIIISMDAKCMYISRQFMNGVMRKNIKEIKFEHWSEEPLVFLILQKMLDGQNDLKAIIDDICQINIEAENEMKEAIKNVVTRNYGDGYSENEFFEKLLERIKKDIGKLERI